MSIIKVGNVLTFGRRHDTCEPIEWIIAHITDEGYGILITRDNYADMIFDNEEPSNPVENRAKYGNNRWSVSNIRQWLNSDKPANEWFTPMHGYDVDPDYSDQNGFLYNFTKSEKGLIIPKKSLQVVSSIDEDMASDVTIDSVWLPSYTEYFGGTNYCIMEGKQFEWFKTQKNRNHDNVFNRPWTRSADVGSTNNVCCLDPDGSYDDWSAYRRHGVRPAIIVHYSLLNRYNTELDKIDVNQITELVLSELFVDTFNNYNDDKEKIVININGHAIGYYHNGRTLTHDIFIESTDQSNGNTRKKVTGDIRSSREQLVIRVAKLLDDVLSGEKRV